MMLDLDLGRVRSLIATLSPIQINQIKIHMKIQNEHVSFYDEIFYELSGNPRPQPPSIY